MPIRPFPLPDDLNERAFDRADLERAGRSQGRIRRRDVSNPFHGVHTVHPPRTLLEQCRTYAVRLRPGQSFSHQTAAALHGLPLPQRLLQDLPLHVSAVRPASPPRTRGVAPHRLSHPPVLHPIDGLPVSAPSEAWVQIAGELTLDEAVEIADHLLTVSPLPPDATRRLLARRVVATRRATAPLLRSALELARCPVLSSGETRVRLLLVRAGVDEPSTNPRVFDDAGRYLGRPDLAWLAQRVGLEYDGAGHADPKQMRSDIERDQSFRDAGWDVVHASADDLAEDGRRQALVARVRRRLALRS